MTYSKEFFKIQLQFAKNISKKKSIPYVHALFKYTCVYVRLFGYIDERPPLETDGVWVDFIRNLPRSQKEQLEYIYAAYLKRESAPKKSTNLTRFGCFSYSYHETTNQFELHFGSHDPKGNLGKDRISARMQDWKNLFRDIHTHNKHNATCKIDTWLLQIEAFKRLLPPVFIESSKLLYTDTTQTLTYWGPLLDRHGRVKLSMKKELFKKLKNENCDHIEDYFPRRAYTSEVPIQVFYDYYLPTS